MTSVGNPTLSDVARTIELQQAWKIGERIGGGGFAEVFSASDGATDAAAKFIPKEPGAEREMLLADVGDARNVVPVLDFGEDGDFWVIVMPRAAKSLRDRLNESPMSPDETIAVLTDVSDALSDLAGRIVHRDLKPENILQLGERWCLTDFGIARYAESSTDGNTRKFALTYAYAAPERWRLEHATAATDVYSLGVVAYELVTGATPFPGPSEGDFRQQHLHQAPPSLGAAAPAALASAIEECLFKAPAARPTASNLRARLTAIAPAADVPPGIARLQQANREAVDRRGEQERQRSVARTAAERRAELGRAADALYRQISGALLGAITQAAPMAEVTSRNDDSWILKLGRGELRFTPATHPNHSADRPYAFEVILAGELTLSVPPDAYGYHGRSHSLWYGDIQTADDFGWYETAFMISPLMRASSEYDPFSLAPDSDQVRQALLPGMATVQAAWPFTRLVPGALDEFIERWAGWFADAADGRLNHPSSMPERNPAGSWRAA
jgi:eukaryotic-like serine/threonine-protein kinase